MHDNIAADWARSRWDVEKKEWREEKRRDLGLQLIGLPENEL